MILDRLTHWKRYSAVHPGFAPAFEFLLSTDLVALPRGRNAIDGERLFVLRNCDPGRDRDGAKLEAHARYIDIQVTLAGEEEIGWKPAAECRDAEAPFSAEKDIIFYRDRPESFFAVPPRSFAIFFPSDAHAPLAGLGELHKAVVKVAAVW